MQELRFGGSAISAGSLTSAPPTAAFRLLCDGPPIASTDVMATRRPYDIRQRSFLFATEVIGYCRSVAAGDFVSKRLAGQLVRAAGSVGANLEEADDGQSKPDFINKNCIALKECREARYWLRLTSVTDGQLTRDAA